MSTTIETLSELDLASVDRGWQVTVVTPYGEYRVDVRAPYEGGITAPMARLYRLSRVSGWEPIDDGRLLELIGSCGDVQRPPDKHSGDDPGPSMDAITDGTPGQIRVGMHALFSRLMENGERLTWYSARVSRLMVARTTRQR